MCEQTGVDGVMFARGAMGDPFLFSRTIQFLTTGTYSKETVKEKLLAGFKELAINIEDKGEKKACLDMRKKFCAYTSGLSGGSALRQKIVAASTLEEYKQILSLYLE